MFCSFKVICWLPPKAKVYEITTLMEGLLYGSEVLLSPLILECFYDTLCWITIVRFLCQVCVSFLHQKDPQIRNFFSMEFFITKPNTLSFHFFCLLIFQLLYLCLAYIFCTVRHKSDLLFSVSKSVYCEKLFNLFWEQFPIFLVSGVLPVSSFQCFSEQKRIWDSQAF